MIKKGRGLEVLKHSSKPLCGSTPASSGISPSTPYYSFCSSCTAETPMCSFFEVSQLAYQTSATRSARSAYCSTHDLTLPSYYCPSCFSLSCLSPCYAFAFGATSAPSNTTTCCTGYPSAPTNQSESSASHTPESSAKCSTSSSCHKFSPPCDYYDSCLGLHILNLYDYMKFTRRYNG